jgi:hypothetical protein
MMSLRQYCPSSVGAWWGVHLDRHRAGHQAEEQDVSGGLGEVLRRADAREILQHAESEEHQPKRDAQGSDAVQHQLVVDTVLQVEKTCIDCVHAD